MRICVKAVALFCSLVLPHSVGAEEISAPDLMSFAHGALPVAIDTGAANLRVDASDAVAIIDGNHGGFVAMRKSASEGDVVEITYALPALTRFTAVRGLMR